MPATVDLECPFVSMFTVAFGRIMSGVVYGVGVTMIDRETVVSGDDRLELRTWLRLLACCNLIEKEIRTRLRNHAGITLPQFDLLAALDRAEGGALVMGELSRRLMVTNGNVTALVDRLVRDGLLEREVSPTDRRVLVVRMTPRGREIFESVAPKHATWLEDLMAAMHRERVEGLYHHLADLKASVSSAA